MNPNKKSSEWKLLVLGVSLVTAAVFMVPLIGKMREAKARANLIGCRSSLKTLGLGCRLFATDHEGRYPDSWSVLTNFIASPRLLICWSDSSKGDLRKVSVADAMASPTYPYEGKSAKEGDPGRVVTYCPHHGCVLLTEGEVLELGSPIGDGYFEIREGRKYLPGGVSYRGGF